MTGPHDRVRPLRFIGEGIDVEFENAPALEKRPGLPAAFTWRGKRYRITRLLAEWHDYERRGRSASNMRPEHAERAALRGSRGVGRDYYRVDTHGGRVFEIYYDRAPSSVTDAKGGWYAFRELKRPDVREDEA